MQTTIYKINSKVLLYNTGNYIQYPIINIVENMKNVCITESDVLVLYTKN